MGSTSQAEYVAFQEKVGRTVYVDNLSPKVTEFILRTALSQFGNVMNIRFIPNYIQPANMLQCALVEMKTVKDAKNVLSVITKLPFMIAGMPRPVRARPAEVEMFDDRPKRPGRKIHCRWLDPSDVDFETAKRIKSLASKHAAEDAFMLKQQLDQEEKLAKQQEENLKANYKKYELIEDIINDRTATSLARQYNINSE